MKRRIAILLAVSMLCSLFTVNGYAMQSHTEEQAKAFLDALYADDAFVIDPLDEQNILEEFENEIQYVENKHDVQITELNEETLDLLKGEAVLNLENDDYSFVDLMGEISRASMEYRIENMNSGWGRILNQDPDVSWSTVRNFGPLYGAHFLNVATGTSEAINATASVNIEAGSEVHGYTIGGNVSVSVEYTCEGPDSGETLRTGHEATHRTAFGVMYGEIVRHVVVYPDGDTFVFYYIAEATRTAESYTTLTKIGIPTYVDSLHNTTLQFANQLEFYDELEVNIELFL